MKCYTNCSTYVVHIVMLEPSPTYNDQASHVTLTGLKIFVIVIPKENFCLTVGKINNLPLWNRQNTFFLLMQAKIFFAPDQCINHVLATWIGIHWNPESLTFCHRGEILALFRGGKFLFLTTVDCIFVGVWLFILASLKVSCPPSTEKNGPKPAVHWCHHGHYWQM